MHPYLQGVGQTGPRGEHALERTRVLLQRLALPPEALEPPEHGRLCREQHEHVVGRLVHRWLGHLHQCEQDLVRAGLLRHDHPRHLRLARPHPLRWDLLLHTSLRVDRGGYHGLVAAQPQLAQGHPIVQELVPVAQQAHPDP